MDDDTKIRRNLTVFSGAVLATDYLDISFSSLATQILKLDSMALDPHRLLILALVILIYLTIRYKFSEEGVKYSAILKTEWENLCQAWIHRWCAVVVRLYAKQGFELRGIFREKISDVVRNMQGSQIRPPNDPMPNIKKVIFGMSSQGPKPWVYTAFTQITWESKSTPTTEWTVNGTVALECSGVMLAMMKFLTTLEMWLYSKGSIQALVPVVLANLAAITLCLRVAEMAP